MGKEVFADTGYSLGVNSFLFAILVDHINEDTVEISFSDIENKRLQFFNCGKICYLNFTKEEFERELRTVYGDYVKPNGEDKWIVNLKLIYGNYINILTRYELRLLQYQESYIKIFYLFKWFRVDERIFDPPYHAITSLLNCKWLYTIREVDSYSDHLFNMAKKIKPDGDNTELLRLMEKIRKISKQIPINDTNMDDWKEKVLSMNK